MPAVVPSAIGFVAGVMAGLAATAAPWTVTPLAAGAALLAWRRRPALALALAACSAGAVWGGAAARSRDHDCRLIWRDGERLSLVLEPRDVARAGGARRFTVVEPRACRGAIVAVGAGEGEGVRVVAATWQREPGFRSSLLPLPPERAGRLIVSRFRPLALAPGLRSRLRIGAERRLESLFGAPRSGLAAALTVSPEAAVPREDRERFTRAGLAHLLSISGFHVGILAGALLLLLKVARIPPDVARWATLAAVAAYVWLLGLPAPALRAAALLAIWFWARLRQRPPVVAALVAATALVVALLDPLALSRPGPWLSFTGVWGCVVASLWWRRLTRERGSPRSRRWFARLEPLAISAGALLATTPVTIVAFGTLTLAALPANAAAVPVAAFAVPALALALGVASLPIPGAASAATLPAGAAGLALDALQFVARAAGALPGAVVTFGPRLLPAAVAAAAALLVLRPPPPSLRRRASAALAGRLAVAAALVVAASALCPVAAVTADGPGLLTLHFLAVGQGDAAVARTPHGRWIVIDGGPRTPGSDAGARRVVPLLRERGVRRVDVVVASHGDADHLGGLPAILRALPASVVLEPGQVLGRSLYREWLAAVGRSGARWHRARAGERLIVDGVQLFVWHPDSAWLARRLPANENSVVVSLEYGRFRAVFPGDAGLPMETERATAIGDVTLLKVGHHGSRSASGPDWLAALRPELCVVSVGANHYGHPDAGVLAALRQGGCDTWRTDRGGDVVVETDGATARVRGAGRDTIINLSGDGP